MPLQTRTHTRDELYAKLWAKPVRDVAQDLGISDVALAKACRKLNVPLPGRTHYTVMVRCRRTIPCSWKFCPGPVRVFRFHGFSA